MIKKRFLKTIQGVCLGVTLSLFGAFGVFAEPLGLSTIDGQIITSRMGGFQHAPEIVELVRAWLKERLPIR